MKKRFLFTLALLAICGMANAQLVKQSAKESPTKQADRDWYNCSPETDGVFGASVNAAYDFLKGKKAKARPIVALIGTGMDIEHEALKDNIWTNKKEKADGKDNDKDGYVDDTHGWNFIGGKDGKVMPYVSREGEREFLRLKDKYGDIYQDGSKYYSFATGEMVECPPPADMAEYRYFTQIIAKESRLYGEYRNRWGAKMQAYYARMFDREARIKYPDTDTLTVDSVIACCAPKSALDSSMRGVMTYAIAMTANYSRSKDWNKILSLYTDPQRFDDAVKKYDRLFARYGNDGRAEIVGDGYLDINDNIYGNNTLLTADAAVGTMIAGVIAGPRGIEGRNNPIAEQALIMPLVVQAGEGEPYLKDMALAIRYAVDHNASIIVLPQQNTLYPEGQKEWMGKAIRYAESKGVLVIVPVFELSRDLSMFTFYPNRWMEGDKELTNLVTVGVSDKNGMPSTGSNFGAKELDLFAPGTEIYSTCTGDTYQMGNGMAMSAATVAGVAALVKTYYPDLTASQIRDILNRTVSSRKGIEVEKNVQKNKIIMDLYLFDQLCLSGGIVNALEAVKAADELSK